MINYNIVLYIGLFLIIGGFCLFLFSQMRLRQWDIEQWKLTQSFNKAKEKMILSSIWFYIIILTLGVVWIYLTA